MKFFFLISVLITTKFCAQNLVNNPSFETISSGGPHLAAIEHLEQIALDLVNYPLNPTETKTINKNQVYRILKEDASLMASSPVLQSFYTNSQSTNRKVFEEVQSKISTGDIAIASSLNTSANPNDNVEQNYKDFYAMAIKQADGTLNASDSAGLAQIAYSCPTINGAMVHQARVLLNVLYDRYILYPDNCPEVSNARLAHKQNEEAQGTVESEFDAVLFPNPGANTFNIATFGLMEGEIEIVINDVSGKIVFNSKLNVANALGVFNLEAQNGIYFVKITNKNKTIIKKLVVQY